MSVILPGLRCNLVMYLSEVKDARQKRLYTGRADGSNSDHRHSGSGECSDNARSN